MGDPHTSAAGAGIHRTTSYAAPTEPSTNDSSRRAVPGSLSANEITAVSSESGVCSAASSPTAGLCSPTTNECQPDNTQRYVIRVWHHSVLRYRNPLHIYHLAWCTVKAFLQYNIEEYTIMNITTASGQWLINKWLCGRCHNSYLHSKC